MFRTLTLLLAATVLATCAVPAAADPCGMVPPVFIGEGPAITRIGVQKTYVFYRDGIETFVIRPGFSGKVEDFGMLIPFPTPPAMRKVDDAIFTHLVNAIDPPEVVLDLRPQPELRFANRATGGAMPNSAPMDDGLEVDEVAVLNQEAIGMYEVVVLQAGSAAALSRWMEQHDYVYPEGMDAACNDYIADGWCFVAVKTRVAPKVGVDPSAGQRDVNPGLPPGASFDGNVQAMGFRFRVDELVVPMRLSSFNAGELHNVVYLLADEPKAIEQMTTDLVDRQIGGLELYRNLTAPLPLRVIGGEWDDVEDEVKERVNRLRDPLPHSGLARDLVAFDLLTAGSGNLIHPHETAEKSLLEIGEYLGLRGPAIDALNHDALADMRVGAADEALKGLDGMTMTVVDGDFEREVLGRENLTFVAYEMPVASSGAAQPRRADNRVATLGPDGTPSWYGQWNDDGTVGTVFQAPVPESLQRGNGQVPEYEDAAMPADGSGNRGGDTGPMNWLLIGGVGLLGLAIVVILFSRRGGGAAVLVVAIGTMALSPLPALAQDADVDAQVLALIDKLADKEEAPGAVAELVRMGDPAVPHLIGEAVEGVDIVQRGWAIVALGEIGGEEIDERLAGIHADANQDMLVRTWAAAARVHIADSVADLTELAGHVATFPALGRPLGMKLVGMVSDGTGVSDLEQLLQISIQVPSLTGTLGQPIVSQGPEALADVMVNAADETVRQRAAGYLGGLSQGSPENLTAAAEATVAVYAFDAETEQVPWTGGPLWLPQLQWPKGPGKELVVNLVQWHLWCDLHGQDPQKQQIHNNIRSLGLAGAVGYESPGWSEATTDQWLGIIGKLVGRAELRRLLERQGVADQERFQAVLRAAPEAGSFQPE